jgi:hypothetical protein
MKKLFGILWVGGFIAIGIHELITGPEQGEKWGRIVEACREEVGQRMLRESGGTIEYPYNIGVSRLSEDRYLVRSAVRAESSNGRYFRSFDCIARGDSASAQVERFWSWMYFPSGEHEIVTGAFSVREDRCFGDGSTVVSEGMLQNTTEEVFEDLQAVFALTDDVGDTVAIASEPLTPQRLGAGEEARYRVRIVAPVPEEPHCPVHIYGIVN